MIKAGGAAGRGDAMVGAVESQQADGVLHIHLFLFLQTVGQFSTLHGLSTLLRERLLSADAMKLFASYSRCASYPDVAAFEQQRERIEQAWPAYAEDPNLSRLPRFFWQGLQASGAERGEQYCQRLQHALAHMNHHIHPLVASQLENAALWRRAGRRVRPLRGRPRKGHAKVISPWRSS